MSVQDQMSPSFLADARQIIDSDAEPSRMLR